MDIRGLGYIGIDVADIDAWRSYAEMLGTMVIPDADGFRMRIDERPFRTVARPTDGDEGLAFAGWELADASALDVAAAELAKAGCSTEAA